MKTMLRIFTLSLFLAGITTAGFGQHYQGHQENSEKFKSLKISFITEKLELTPGEAEKFWPIYNEHEKNKNEFRRKRRAQWKELSEMEEVVSDQQAKEIIDQQIQIRKEELEVDIEFHNELEKILSPKKVMLLYMAEIQFREHMLRMIRDDREQTKTQRKELP